MNTIMPDKQSCVACGKPTELFDNQLRLRVCSESCHNKLVVQHRVAAVQQVMQRHIEQFRPQINAELMCQHQYQSASKDILIVVHNQLDYLKQCIQSVQAHTENYKLYIWDNGSQPDTVEYLKELDKTGQADVWFSDKNEGFIKPNNQLISFGTNEYVVLLNSDTKVMPDWDKALIGFMQQNPEVKQTGYMGCKLDENGMGGRADLGYNVDYICGWGTCFPRTLYQEIGLFDRNLQFAYCEDADFSLRVQAAGHKIYVSHLMLVHHYENKTIKEVQKEGNIDVRASFDYNHKYMRLKWVDYLAQHRVDLRLPQA